MVARNISELMTFCCWFGLHDWSTEEHGRFTVMKCRRCREQKPVNAPKQGQPSGYREKMAAAGR